MVSVDQVDFFNRERELAQLERAWQTDSPQLITLWGRRRVGKSTLLSRFAADKRGIYLYGTRIAEADILRGLSHQAAGVLGDSYLRASPFSSWPAALEYLEGKAASERLLVILDEFPYLCDMTQGLDTLVQHWWDRLASTRRSLMVVLAGSAFSFMEGLTGARGPLHGRRTGQVEVHPFDYLDATRFFEHLDPVDRVRAYACYGGIPAYLAHWAKGNTVQLQLESTLLAAGHVLFREGEELLRTEFHQEALYASILRAIATGEERASDIARAVGRGGANEILDHLRRLQELRFVRREVPVTEWDRVRTQRALYRLADPYLRFWYRFVLPHQSLIQLGHGGGVWRREVAPVLDEFVARTTWEEVCTQYLWRRLSANRPGVVFSHLGRWWDGKQEMDLVGLMHGKVVLAGECRWSNRAMTGADLLTVQARAARLPLGDDPLWVLASRSGFEPALRRRAAAGDTLLLTPEDLFAET